MTAPSTIFLMSIFTLTSVALYSLWQGRQTARTLARRESAFDRRRS